MVLVQFFIPHHTLALYCRLVDLYNLLAIVLPDDVVNWQVVPRLLGQVSAAPA